MKEEWTVQSQSISSHLQVHSVLKGLQVDLGAVVRPGAELHLAALLVEGEEGDVDGAGRLVDGRRHPADTPGVKQLGLGHVGDGKLSICTGKKKGGGARKSVKRWKEEWKLTRKKCYFIQQGSKVSTSSCLKLKKWINKPGAMPIYKRNV